LTLGQKQVRGSN
jgi:hypothetical protein